MSEPVTRVTLFVPGTPASVDAWNKALHGMRIEDGRLVGELLDTRVDVGWVDNDGEFGVAFSFGTVDPDVVEKIEAAPGALVLRFPIDLRDGRNAIVAVVERLRDAGALAVRIEESKLGWEVARWLELFSSINAWDWHRGAIMYLRSGDLLQSCGMHAFSLPDSCVTVDSDPGVQQNLVSTLAVYQLAEDPVIRSGQTFTPDRETPRRVVERWPDTSYPPDHSCHNPYGVWRLGPPGGTARSIGQLEPIFMPSLRVLLAAFEEKTGKPLTQNEVEAARDEGVCIAMEPRDAKALERERGYADLDPELAWEQWQAIQGAGL